MTLKAKVTLRGASHFKTKYALPEIRESLGDRGEPRVTEQLSAGPGNVRIAKPGVAQQRCPEIRLLMFEPLNVGR